MVRKIGRRVCSGLRRESHPTHSELHTGYRAVGRRAGGQPGDKTAQKVGSAQSSSGLSNMQQAEVLNPRVANQACEDNTNFTLVLGGPLYQLYLRTKLARPTLELVPRRVASIALICWLPLLVLSLLNGSALGGVAVAARPLRVEIPVAQVTAKRRAATSTSRRDVTRDRGRPARPLAAGIRPASRPALRVSCRPPAG